MSLYCMGYLCPRKKECLRVEAYNDLIAEHPEIEEMTLPEQACMGIWFVTQSDCKMHGYDSGVFPKKGGTQ